MYEYNNRKYKVKDDAEREKLGKELDNRINVVGFIGVIKGIILFSCVVQSDIHIINGDTYRIKSIHKKRHKRIYKYKIKRKVVSE